MRPGDIYIVDEQSFIVLEINASGTIRRIAGAGENPNPKASQALRAVLGPGGVAVDRATRSSFPTCSTGKCYASTATGR